MAPQMNVATDNMMSQCFYLKVCQIFNWMMHLFLFNWCVEQTQGIPIELKRN